MTAKTLARRRALQVWQAYSMIHSAEVKQMVDAEYKEYLNHAEKVGET